MLTLSRFRTRKNVMEAKARMHNLLIELYGAELAPDAEARLEKVINRIGAREPTAKPATYFSEKDTVLITYGDTLSRIGEHPLASMHRFAREYLSGAVSTIHFLPFFPFSSDDGFAVQDFFQIDPALGDWADVEAIGKDFGLMFDYVINHFSSQSDWLQHYLAAARGFEKFAIAVDPKEDLSAVTRPRSLPLLTEFTRSDGQAVHLWTTFSADQVDFNFKSLDVLEKMVAVMLYYVQRGADLLRLDAIAYLWKEIGTACVHLPQTHQMVKLLRSILDQVAPEVMLITETNVPHSENISYFGPGSGEAQMVYNFSLPPLLLHTFLSENATALQQWARNLSTPSATTTFFNFTASHDGIGVRPLEGILSRDEIDDLTEAVKSAGGQVSTKRNADGTDSPYELNISYVDAIAAGSRRGRAKKFMASQAIQYALPGVPATYIHSLLGSRNWIEGMRQTGRNRTINREKLDLDQIIADLGDRQTFRSRVFYPYRRLMRIRARQPAFHPNAEFNIIDSDPALFVIRRACKEQILLAVTNISSQTVPFDPLKFDMPANATDLISNKKWDSSVLSLEPYQYVWLEHLSE